MTSTAKIIVSVAIAAAVIIINKILQILIDRYIRKYDLPHKRGLAIHKVKSIVLYVIGFIMVIYVWGIDLENVWIFLTGFIGLVAIGFFAVWSILSNIFAGIVLFFSQTLRIHDTIEIMPDAVGGEIKDINLFFVILIDKDGNIINIPNNVIFQKMIKKR